MHTTSRFGTAALTAGLTLAVGLSIPAAASAAEPVHIEVDTSFVGPSYFTSNLDGCSSGEVVDDRGRLNGSRNFGIFNGFKVFECDEGGSFVIRLHATFDDSGAVGTWAFVGGDYAGNGRLVGTPVTDGITDVYDGTVR
jgi:hypothetical protein